MNGDQPQRISRPLSKEEQERLDQQRALIAQELPDLSQRDRLREEAQSEPTLSGEIRRSVHASSQSLANIAAHAGVTTIQLDEFLTGERTLRSDVLDRLANALGLQLARTS